MAKRDNDPRGCQGRKPLPGQRVFIAPETPSDPPGDDQFALAPALLEAAKAAGIVPPDATDPQKEEPSTLTREMPAEHGEREGGGE